MCADKHELAARKQPKQAPKKPAQANDWGVTFVNVDLVASDKEKIKSADLTQFDVVTTLQRLVEQGFKVTVAFDDRGGGCIASMTGKATALEANRNKCMTARGSDVFMALVVLDYKWTQIMGGEEFMDWLARKDEDMMG